MNSVSSIFALAAATTMTLGSAAFLYGKNIAREQLKENEREVRNTNQRRQC